MPSILTHRLMAEDVFSSLKNGYIKQAIAKHKDVFSIGSSGPDVFFFYQPMKGLIGKKTLVSSYGGWLHTMHTNDMFELMLKIAWGKRNPSHMAYLAGLVCHWAMDALAHPYVYSRCGHGSKINGNLHRDMESTLDFHLLNKKEKTLQMCKPTDIVKHNANTYLTLYDLYQPVLLEYFGAYLEKGEMKRALHDFLLTEQVLYDPYGIKRFGARMLESVIGQKGAGSAMVIPCKDTLRFDVMNEEHLIWVHPCTNEEHHESFMELFEQACQLATDVLCLMEAYMQNKVTLDVVLEKIGNRNFSTGLDSECEMRYFSILQDHL